MNREHLKMIAAMHTNKIADLEQSIQCIVGSIAKLGSELNQNLTKVDTWKNYLAETCMAIVQCESERCDCEEEENE